MSKKELKTLIKDLKLNYVNSDITKENFPDDGRREKVEILHYDETLTTEELLKKMEYDGYAPANLYELLEWANQDKEWNGKDFVIALGSVWRDRYGNRVAPCLLGLGSERGLDLLWTEYGWDKFFRFAAVRK